MFEDNHIEESDLLFRSILENGQEEVPEHVWDGVAAGLDKAAKRRTVVLWMGRAAAVAAAVNTRHSSASTVATRPSAANCALVSATEGAT